MSGQYADEPLIPGEQFGLGGERTVRGFEERTIAADDGILFNFEVWAPPLPQLYDVRFFVFADVGHKHLEFPQNPQIPSDTISSAGIGFRVDVREYLYVSADYGHTIAEAGGEASDTGNVKTHFNVVVRY
jgi:hemolysin activation/secretion protein